MLISDKLEELARKLYPGPKTSIMHCYIGYGLNELQKLKAGAGRFKNNPRKLAISYFLDSDVISQSISGYD